MIGLVLAAGAGRRLGPLTEALPKTLLPVAGKRTILDIALANLRAAGLSDVVLVTGFAAERIDERLDELSATHGVRLHTIFNDRAQDWNNAYSLWLARQWFAEGVLLVNGDTVHPPSVQRTLLAERGPPVLLAVDDAKPLAEEEMKVVLNGAGRLTRITKTVDPRESAGEYIGCALLEPAAAEPLAAALEATWSADPSLYYEDGYHELARRGGEIKTASVGGTEWVEVDDPGDLTRAREIACRY